VFWLVGLVAVGGCDRLPWPSNGDDKEAQATSPAAQRPVTPSRPSVAPGDVLATVNGVSISRHDVESRIQELKALLTNLGQPWTPLSDDQLEGVLDELINSEVLSQDAVARGLDRSSDTQRRWEFTRRVFFTQEWLRWTQEEREVGSADVERYYEDNKRGFRVPERRQLRQIIVASEDQAKRALAQLLGESVEFAALAQQISLAPTAAQGGLLPGRVMRAAEKAFMYPTDADATAAGVTSLDPALEAAAFAIDQVNGLSNYVKGSDNRFHIFQLVEREEERQRPLSEVWDQIKNFLLAQQLQQRVEALRAKAEIERFPERLEGVTQ
jgi:peptidyl-prolyl cis-trans isomerase C